MGRTKRIPLAVLLLCGALFAGSPTAGAAEPSTHHLVVVFPGGPAPGSSAQEVIGQFTGLFSEDVGRKVEGHYFNEIAPAVAFLKEHPDSFAMGSTGFFLAQREALGLVPLASVALPDDQPEQYFVVVKKGGVAKLEDLKGKAIAGQPLFESPQFLKHVVFGGAFDVAAEAKPEATGRPLSAIRKVLRGDLDAVLLNPIQHSSLAALPGAEELVTIYKSEPVASVGFCMRDSEANRALQDAMMKALTRLATTEDGAAACKTFGIAGFEAVDEKAVAQLIESYAAAE